MPSRAFRKGGPLWRIVDIILRKETRAAISKMAIIRLKNVSSLTLIRSLGRRDRATHLHDARERKRKEYRRDRCTRAHVFHLFYLSSFNFHFSFFISHLSKAPVILAGYFSRFTEKPVLSRKSLADASQIYSSHLRFPREMTRPSRKFMRDREWIMPNFVRPLKRPIAAAHVFHISVHVSVVRFDDALRIYKYREMENGKCGKW